MKFNDIKMEEKPTIYKLDVNQGRKEKDHTIKLKKKKKEEKKKKIIRIIHTD